MKHRVESWSQHMPSFIRPAGEKSSPRADDMPLNYSTLFWLFFVGSILGVVVEFFWCMVTVHHYESRVGLVLGPFNPVYGGGAVVLTVCLKWIRHKRDLWIFLGSLLLGGAFEYLCSLFQELVFGTVSWEYSHTQLNINGRTNLMFAFFWGLLGLIWIKELAPRAIALIRRIPRRANRWLVGILTVFMLLDMLLSAAAVGRQTLRREGAPSRTVFEQFLDVYYSDAVLKEIYPHMQVPE